MGIIDLPIPKVRDELSLHRVGSWEEETVDPNAAWNPSSQKSREPSLSSHAVAFGSFVYGVSQSSSRVDSWVTWKTSFAPYRVCRVVSNHDGSIIVCSTDAGTVALLRGVDGSVLATRKVAVEEDGILPAAHLSFIGRSITNQTTDAVVLGVPNNDPSKPELEFLMVSNIDSVALNDRDQLKVAEAARKMAIKSSLELQRSESGDILAFCGCFVGSDRIRFLTIDAQETIAVLDYSMTNSQLEVVQETVDWKILKEHKDAAVDVDLGLRLCGFKNDKETSLVLFCSLDNGSGPTIHCFNPVELYMSGSFQNEATNAFKKSREKVLAIEALTSPLPESAVAIAVASRSDDGAVIRVLQAGIVNGFLENSHVVYTVPVSDSLRSISMAPILSPNCGPYSFCYKVWQGSENYVCKAFSTPSGGSEGLTLGRIRLMIQSEQFDEADHLIMKIGENALIKDPHAKFHPSEVAVGRLRQILQQGNVCKEESLTQAKVCFHRLSSGCISGNERAGSNLLEAAESIARWATPNDSRTAPSLDEIMTALSAVVKTISEVLKILPHERHPPFEEKKKMMEAQLTALKYLSSVVPEDPEEAFHFTRRFQGSRSPGELFANFVARGCFKYAENMLKSYLRPQITASVAVESILRVQQEADPRSYISLLEELVMPSLCINHELLPSVWIWACRLADDLDDSDRINDAIFLLEVSLAVKVIIIDVASREIYADLFSLYPSFLQSVERGTDELQLRIHSSFASFSPFVERNAARKPRLADRKDYSNTEVSFASASSSPVVHENSNNDAVDNETNLPVPTVLERGRIKGGATKARQMSRSLHKLKRATGEDCEEVSETFLRGKLMHALCLKAARELGLERRVAKLRSFSDFGSIQNFAKELVRSLSMSFGNHHERAEMFSKDFKSFCEHFDVDFDKALLEYTQQLCSSTIASERTIQEAASGKNTAASGQSPLPQI
mgnify:CR=1 FL=1